MGFTSGDNYVSVRVDSYLPSSTSVTLSFFSETHPHENSYGEFTTSFTMSNQDIDVLSNSTVNPSITSYATIAAIQHLKSFNSGCDFDEVQFLPEVTE